MRGLRPAILLATALTVPAIGFAQADEQTGSARAGISAVGDGIETQPVTYVVRGPYLGKQTVRATSGNRHAKDEAGLIGRPVRFDMRVAPIDVKDSNDDGYTDHRDLEQGSLVLVKADLPKNDPGPEPLPVRFVRSLE